ncbi:MAG TPA: recombinase family protein, partial [Symbiobacteriaceae bacterium]|nr:recombinase family protein [Symbiobacteriaceae bacterium]
MGEIRPDRVALYIRWSTDEQTEGTTLETQKERCSLYVRSQGWQVSEELIFIDDGYSGGSLERPALSRLRSLIGAGKVDCVVSYSLDRLSRSVADTVQLVQHEWLGRCVYRSASQPISTEDGNPTGQLIFNILASFAEFERALIRDRTHSGLVRRARQGKYPGTRVPPYGYSRDGKGQLAVEPARAAVVRRMFAMAASGPAGQGPTAIARALEAEGIPSPSGGPWWSH